MRRMGFGKLVLIFFALGFGVFYGLDVATKGIEQINGPATGAVQSAAAQQTSTLPTPTPAGKTSAQTVSGSAGKQQKETSVKQQPVQPVQQAELHTSFVNRLSNRTGDALKRLASLAMEAVSSLFRAILG